MGLGGVMSFSFPIEIASGVTADSPTRVETPLCAGKLVKCGIFFPYGCAGYVRIRILYYEYQLFPVNTESWFRGDNHYIEFDTDIDIIEGWSEFKVEGYNEDDTYTHTPIVDFVVLPLTNIDRYPVPKIGDL